MSPNIHNHGNEVHLKKTKEENNQIDDKQRKPNTKDYQSAVRDLFVKINEKVNVEESFKLIGKILDYCINNDIVFDYCNSALYCIQLTKNYRGIISLRSLPLFKRCIDYCLDVLNDDSKINTIAKHAYHLDDSSLFYLEDKGYEFNFRFEDSYLSEYGDVAVFDHVDFDYKEKNSSAEDKIDDGDEERLDSYYAEIENESKRLAEEEKKRLKEEKESEESARRIREKEAKKTRSKCSNIRLRYKRKRRNGDYLTELERLKATKEIVSYEQLLDKSFTFEKIKEVKDTLVRRVKGGCYYFQCNANAFLDITIVSMLVDKCTHNINPVYSEIAPKKVDRYIKEARLHVESLSGIAVDSKPFFSKYKIPRCLWHLYKMKNDEITFGFIFSEIESEGVLELLFGKDNNFNLPSLYICKECDYHVNDKRKYDNHRVTKTCRVKRGIIEPKQVAFYCKECDFTGSKSAYEIHRNTNKCNRARGLKPKKKIVYIQCPLCPESPPFIRGWAYNRHRETSKRCLKRQREKLKS